MTFTECVKSMPCDGESLAGVLTLPQAVYRLTGQTAKLFGIRDRGTLKVGNAADLMLFDPKTVDRGAKKRVRDLPAGGARLTTPAIGVQSELMKLAIVQLHVTEDDLLKEEKE